MISSSDLITLPYTPDLTRAGIDYACRSLHYTYDRMGGSPFDRLRRIAAGVAVEIAFRRLLSERCIPYDTQGNTPFTDPDRYDICIGGRRCDIKSFQIFKKDEIRKIRKNPDYLMGATALVPLDQLEAGRMQSSDLYIFAFITALVTHSRGELDKAMAAGQPVYMLHPLPANWAQPKRWESLGKLALKSEASSPLSLEIGGQGVDRRFQREQITLSPQSPVQARGDFYTLAYLHASERPDGRLSLIGPRYRHVYTIVPADWDNIWVYGMEIILAGYMTCGEYRRKAQPLPAGNRVLQYARTRTANMSLPLSELRPLDDLLDRVRDWSKRTLRSETNR